ncbi:MAG: hypothetical protein ACTSQP_10475 [Promethearchaeota archaeon]
MIKFLKQLQLSDAAITIYTKILGKRPFTFYELKIFVPEVPQEQFPSIIDELLELKLLIELKLSNYENLKQYLAIPPFSPILSYYSNIKAGLSQIEDAVNNLIESTLNQIFQEENKVELDTLLNEFNESKKDIEEDILIQKQEVAEIGEELEIIEEFKKIMQNMQERIKGISKTQFANLIKTITKIKSKIIKRVERLELKKGKEEFLEIIEEVFKEKTQKIVDEFTSNMFDLIENEFNSIIEPINLIEEKISQTRKEFENLFLGIINNVEKKNKKLEQIILKSKQNLDENVENLKNMIKNQIFSIVKDSIDQISNLNNPIIDVLNNVFNVISDKNIFEQNQIWFLNSRTKINEVISNLLVNSKEKITFIFPKLEHHIRLEQLKNISDSLQIKIVASDPHVNSLVTSIKELPNVSYRKLENENIIAFKADNNCLVISTVIKDSQDPLNDVIGFGTNYAPLINILAPIIETTWNSARSDFAPSPKIERKKVQPTTSTSATGIQTSTSTTISGGQTVRASQVNIQQSTPQYQPQTQTQSTPQTPSQTPPQVETPPQPQIQSQPQAQQQFISSVQPTKGDDAGGMIHAAFNAFLQQINSLKGTELGKALEDVANIILEVKGFSVTLHSIRRTINELKTKDRFLEENEKHELFQSVEEWKQRLL